VRTHLGRCSRSYRWIACTTPDVKCFPCFPAAVSAWVRREVEELILAPSSALDAALNDESNEPMNSLASLPPSLKTLRWKELFVVTLEINAVQHAGNGIVIGAVGGGKFTGSRLSGRVLPGGADWQSFTSDGAAHLDCRIVLETSTGDLIAMTYRGIRSGPPEVMARLSNGSDVSADEYYLRISPMFSTAAPQFDWMNRIVAVGAGQRLPQGPVYSVFEIV